MLHKLLVLSVFAFVLVGCNENDRASTIAEYPETSDVRSMSGGYIMYDLEGGEVTCREHWKREELACWRNW